MIKQVKNDFIAYFSEYCKLHDYWKFKKEILKTFNIKK